MLSDVSSALLCSNVYCFGCLSIYVSLNQWTTAKHFCLLCDGLFCVLSVHIRVTLIKLDYMFNQTHRARHYNNSLRSNKINTDNSVCLYMRAGHCSYVCASRVLAFHNETNVSVPS